MTQKYAIWRHENSIGNSAEHTYGLAKHFKRHNITDFEIYVEKEFQKYFAMCIPGVTEEHIRFFNDEILSAKSKIATHHLTQEIYFPNVYREPTLPAPPGLAEAYYESNYPKKFSYPASWGDLSSEPDCKLEFPYSAYQNKHNLPSNCILMQIREIGTHDKRVEGHSFERDRFVDIRTFFRIAEHFANKGFTVIRIGDKNQTPMPNHPNIIDFAKVEDRNMLDDLYLISESKLFISTDSGIWPMAGAMKKNLVLADVTSVFGFDWKTQGVIHDNFINEFRLRKWKSAVTDWLPKDTTRILYKNLQNARNRHNLRLLDNSMEEILSAAEELL